MSVVELAQNDASLEVRLQVEFDERDQRRTRQLASALFGVTVEDFEDVKDQPA